MGYTHLTREERYQMESLRRAGCSQACMAATLGRDRATMSRELRRNAGARGYRAGAAERRAQARARRARSRPRITARQWAAIERLVVEWQWSPEQIAQRSRREATLQVSAQRIYQRIWAERATGARWSSGLRCRRLRRNRYGRGRSRRGRIPGRVGIEHRPAAVEHRAHIGHWEADTIIGGQKQGAALSLVERRSRYLRLARLRRRTAQATARQMRRRLAGLADRVVTITADNGKEFCAHAQIAASLEANFYFCAPQQAWQRGTNENTNGLVRQYLSKGRDLSTVSGAEISKIERRLNHRPRKCLGYRTPHEVFYNTQSTLTVALRA